MPARVIAGRLWQELAFSPKGLLWLPACSAVLSVLVYLFLTNADLSLLDQKTMMFMTAQAVLVLGLLAVTVTAVDIMAGERERGTLEPLLAAPVSPEHLLGGYLAGALAPWGAAAWTVGLSSRTPSLRTGLQLALVVYAGLAVPALLSPALRTSWVGRAYDAVNPFASVMNTLDSVIIDEQGFGLQRLRLLTLLLFATTGLFFAWRRLASLSLE
jgi:ABC-2 type transport system permease protein